MIYYTKEYNIFQYFVFNAQCAYKKYIFIVAKPALKCYYIKAYKKIVYKGGLIMARVCMITGKGPASGNARSHSLVATRRKWGVNLQKVKLEINGQVKTVRISARALRTLKKAG